VRPDEPARGEPLSLPPPEQLGIGTPRAAAVESFDWNALHRRLGQLGSLGAQVQKLPEGGYRFVCLLPTAQPERAQRIEAHGTSEAEAARLALARAEQWAGARR
jgi:hypothetical protein